MKSDDLVRNELRVKPHDQRVVRVFVLVPWRIDSHRDIFLPKPVYPAAFPLIGEQEISIALCFLELCGGPTALVFNFNIEDHERSGISQSLRRRREGISLGTAFGSMAELILPLLGCYMKKRN